MKKAILLLFMFMFCGVSYGATLTPNNVPKVNTGGSTPKIEDSSIWAQGSNVGIGTTDPQYALDVAGEINAVTDITVNGTSVCLSDATNCPPFLNGWTDAGTSVVLTTSSDNVGIGTINPQAKLHVKGGIIADGSFSGMLLGNNMKIDGDTTRKMTFSQTAGTYNENVRFDLDTTTNTLAVDSTTGVTDIDMSPFTVTASAFVGDGSGLTGISGGSGGVGIGTTGWMPYYAANGSNVVASNNIQLVGANVGIGTSTASQKLTVTGNQIINSTGALYFGDTSKFLVASATTNGNIDFYTASSLKRMSIQNGGSVVINDDSTDDIVPFRVETNTDANALYADGATNNIGIGTVGPVSKLQVNGTVTAIAFSGDGSALTGISSSGGGWQDGGTNVYLTATSDNVGIGTTTPSTTLEIVKQGTQAPLMVSATATGDGNYLIVNSAGNVGMGTVLPSAILDVVSANYPVSEFTRTTSGTNTILGAVKYKGLSSGTVADGFGINFGAFIEGSGLAETQIGELAFIRDGANNSGAITFRPYATGTANERMRISSGGNVGIGTSKPLSLVSIGTGIAVADYTNVGSGDVYIQNDLEVDGTVYMGSCSGAGCGGSNGWVDGGTNIYASPTTDNVAIGTTTPTQKLHVVGTVLATSFVGDGTGITGLSAGGWTDLGTTLHNSTTSDNVGIGTVSASQKLEVVGTIKATEFQSSSTSAGSLVLGEASANGSNTITVSAPSSVASNRSCTLQDDSTPFDDCVTPASGGWTDGGPSVYTTTTTDYVGIGTTGVAGKALDILAVEADVRLRSSDAAGYTNIGFENSAGSAGEVGIEATSDGDAGDVYLANFSNNDLKFLTNSVLRIRLTAGGMLRYIPTDTPDTCNAGLEGGLYFDNSLNEFCDCDGSSWAQVDGGGAC